MPRGRRHARHAAVRELTSRNALGEPLDNLEVAFDEWMAIGSINSFESAIEAMGGALQASSSQLADHTDLTREDKIRMAAIRYRRATVAATSLSRMEHAAIANREQALAKLVEALAVPPDIPIYGVTLIKRLIAEGAIQRDLHPASRRKVRAMLQVLRDIAPTGNDGKPFPYLRPPVRTWADLPREFAGYRLKDVAPSDHMGRPEPLPPYTDIAQFDPHRMPPEERETRSETYRHWDEILDQWVAGGGLGLDGRPVNRLGGSTSRAWLLLLGHRLSVPDEIPGSFEDLVITSPWEPDKAVKPVWIGHGDQS